MVTIYSLFSTPLIENVTTSPMPMANTIPMTLYSADRTPVPAAKFHQARGAAATRLPKNKNTIFIVPAYQETLPFHFAAEARKAIPALSFQQ